MTWARSAVAVGLLVLLAAFAVGTEHRLSTSVAGTSQSCGASISASWLVPGTPDRVRPGPAATDDERRAAAACGPVVRESRMIVVILMGLGGLLALAGVTAIRERHEVEPRAAMPAHV